MTEPFAGTSLGQFFDECAAHGIEPKLTLARFRAAYAPDAGPDSVDAAIMSCLRQLAMLAGHAKSKGRGRK